MADDYLAVNQLNISIAKEQRKCDGGHFGCNDDDLERVTHAQQRSQSPTHTHSRPTRPLYSDPEIDFKKRPS